MSAVGKQQLATGETGMQPSVSPVKFFETMNAYQRTSALKAAIDLELCAVVGKTNGGLAEISQRSKAPERGVRMLCDFLVISGFLNMLSIAR